MTETPQEMSMAVNIPPSAPPHVYSAAAEKCLEWGRPDGALQVSELGLQRHPSYTGLKVFRAEALLLHQRFEKGEEDLRDVLAAEPQHPRAIKLLAHLLMGQRRFKDAIPILERAEFILASDPEIPKWLAAAEEGLQKAEDDALLVGPSFLFSEETKERLGELASLPGVRAVSASNGDNLLHLGPEGDKLRLRLERLKRLEERVGAVLVDAGLGAISEVSVQDADILWTVRHGANSVLRLAADKTVREGLLAWHCSKILEGEGA